MPGRLNTLKAATLAKLMPYNFVYTVQHPDDWSLPQLFEAVQSKLRQSIDHRHGAVNPFGLPSFLAALEEEVWRNQGLIKTALRA